MQAIFRYLRRKPSTVGRKPGAWVSGFCSSVAEAVFLDTCCFMIWSRCYEGIYFLCIQGSHSLGGILLALSDPWRRRQYVLGNNKFLLPCDTVSCPRKTESSQRYLVWWFSLLFVEHVGLWLCMSTVWAFGGCNGVPLHWRPQTEILLGTQRNINSRYCLICKIILISNCHML